MLAAGAQALPENRSTPTEGQLSGIINSNSKERIPDRIQEVFGPNLRRWRAWLRIKGAWLC